MKLGGWAPHELHDHEAEEVARDEAEGVRLAYVAATRARDLLVVPALGDEPWEGGWFSPLNRALYPPSDARRDATRGPKCPAVQVEGHRARAAERGAGRPDHRLSRRCTLPDGRLLGRLVGSGRARARREAAVRRAPRGPDRQGRAAQVVGRWTHGVRSVAARAADARAAGGRRRSCSTRYAGGRRTMRVRSAGREATRAGRCAILRHRRRHRRRARPGGAPSARSCTPCSRSATRR